MLRRSYKIPTALCGAPACRQDFVMINFELAKKDEYRIMQELRRVIYLMPVIAYGQHITESDMVSRNISGELRAPRGR
eukprot:2304505-Pyramimonas_sp.AAC.1